MVVSSLSPNNSNDFLFFPEINQTEDETSPSSTILFIFLRSLINVDHQSSNAVKHQRVLNGKNPVDFNLTDLVRP